jgi:hypothetical protein
LDNFDLDSAIARIKFFDAQPHPPEQSWYGQDILLREWAGLPNTIPILLLTHHGVELTLETMQSYINNRNPIIVSRKDFAKLYSDKYGKQAFVSGCPAIHYRRKHKIEKDNDANGTIVFPAHSTHHINADYDIERYISDLLSLPEEFHPISACIYWKDLMDGRGEPFIKNGIKVYTAGHMFDPKFYNTFYSILRRFKYSTSNHTFSSSNPLSMEMGIDSFFLGPSFTSRTDGGDPNRQKKTRRETDFFDEIDDKLAVEYYDVFPRYQPGMGPKDIAMSPRLREIVSIMHGCDDPQLDPGLIRAILFQAYALFHPKGKAYLKLAVEHLGLLKEGRHEAVFADQPEMLDFCRVIISHPELVFQRGG